MTFERFTGRFTLAGRLRARSALRVGGGVSATVFGSDQPVVRDALGQPYIPGSTLKGALRASAERTIRAVRPGRQRACAITGSPEQRCVSPSRLEQLETRAAGDEARLSALLLAETCWSCQVFGAPWLASRVACADAPLIPDSWPGHTQVRDGLPLDRDTETLGAGVRFDYEVVPAGVEFGLHLRAATDLPWQLGLLMLSLRELDSGRVRLGGGRSRGLGQVALLVDRRELVGSDPDSLLQFLATADERGRDVEEATVQSWVAALLDCLRQDALPAEAS